MLIIHYTHLDAAISIAKSGIYQPSTSNIYNIDNGLNCFIYGRDHQPDQANSREARLIFDWSGPVEEWDGIVDLKQEKNVLYTSGSWRAFVPAGAYEFLTLERIDSTDGAWISFAARNDRYTKFLPFWTRCRHRKAENIKTQMTNLIGFGRRVVVGDEGCDAYFSSEEDRINRLKLPETKHVLIKKRIRR